MPVPQPSLRDLLSAFCQEANSERGVTGPTTRDLVATIAEHERLLRAAKRLIRELSDDGITDAGMASARAVLTGQEPAESEPSSDTALAEEVADQRLLASAARMDLLYLATQVRLQRDLQKQADGEAATPTTNSIAYAAQGSGRIIDKLIDDILGPRGEVPVFRAEPLPKL